jgi:hypothetical protein
MKRGFTNIQMRGFARFLLISGFQVQVLNGALEKGRFSFIHEERLFSLVALPLDENPLADWPAHLVAGRSQFIFLSTRSRCNRL